MKWPMFAKAAVALARITVESLDPEEEQRWAEDDQATLGEQHVSQLPFWDGERAHPAPRPMAAQIVMGRYDLTTWPTARALFSAPSSSLIIDDCRARNEMRQAQDNRRCAQK